MLPVIKLQGVKVFSADPAIRLSQSVKQQWYGAQRDPSKEMCIEVSEMTQWTSTISIDA